MKVKYLNSKDGHWSVSIQLDDQEWPPVSHPWEDDTWIHRPVWRWVQDNIPSSCFTCRGMLLFRKESDAEWFRMVWEQVP